MEYAYIGLIMPFAGNFAPQGWLFCQGQTLPIAQYTALFSVIGTQFGGNGTTNFQLPDLQQRILIGAGDTVRNGATMGAETATLTADHLPAHSHDFMASDTVATLQAPAGAYLAKTGKTDTDYNKTSTSIAPLAATAIGSTGSATPAPFSVRQPAVSINFVICTNGEYPSRS
jgi:microcystin-dependent protein